MSEASKKIVDHLWMTQAGNLCTIGLTAAIKEEIGTIMFATFPKEKQYLKQGDSLLEVEAEKSVTEFFSPISGVVIQKNQAAEQEPTLLDTKTEEESWLVVLDTSKKA